MTTTIKAKVERRWHPRSIRAGSTAPDKSWRVHAVAIDHEHPNPVETIRVTRTGYAHSFPEALQLAQVARQRLHDALMDEVHESRATRRTSKEPTA